VSTQHLRSPALSRVGQTSKYRRPVNQEVLVVDRAGVTDIPAAQDLIHGARQWLRSRGIDQWQDAVPDAVLLRDAEQGDLFVVRQDQVIVAMVTMSDSDSETWGVDSSPAVYVHRLAVAQTHRGSRLGQRLLAWVEARAAERGAVSVRLDGATDNPRLRRFYEQQGFRHVRDVAVTTLEGGRQLASSLCERELTHESIPDRTGRTATTEPGLRSWGA
jgi:ribosomal protein S18 acetylase RimI-like enzyme